MRGRAWLFLFLSGLLTLLTICLFGYGFGKHPGNNRAEGLPFHNARGDSEQGEFVSPKVAEVELQRAYKLESEGDHEAARLAYTRATRAALAVRDFPTAATAMRHQALLLNRRGEHAQAYALVLEAIELDERHELADNLVNDKLALAAVLVSRGEENDLEDARALYGEAIQLASRLETINSDLVMLAKVGEGYLLREENGDVEGSLQAYKEALLYFQQRDDRGQQADLWYRIGLRYLDLENWSEALTSFRRSRDYWGKIRVEVWNGRSPDALIGRSRLAECYTEIMEIEARHEQDEDVRPSSPVHPRESELARLSAALDDLEGLPGDNNAPLAWEYQYARAELNRLWGKNVEQELGDLEREASTAENRFLANYSLAQYYYRAADEGAEAALANIGKALHAFEQAYCGIPQLKRRYHDLSDLSSQLGQPGDGSSYLCEKT